MTAEIVMIFLMCVYAPVTIVFVFFGTMIVLGWLND